MVRSPLMTTELDLVIQRKKERQQVFLETLRGDKDGVPKSIRVACEAAGISRTTFRNWRQTEPEFMELFEDAFEDGTDTIEDEGVRRAVKGVKQDVYHQGEVVGEKQVYSDQLMTFFLAGRRPQRYRQSGDVNVQVNSAVIPADDNQISRALSLLLAQAQANKAKQVA